MLVGIDLFVDQRLKCVVGCLSHYVVAAAGVMQIIDEQGLIARPQDVDRINMGYVAFGEVAYPAVAHAHGVGGLLRRAAGMCVEPLLALAQRLDAVHVAEPVLPEKGNVLPVAARSRHHGVGVGCVVVEVAFLVFKGGRA